MAASKHTENGTSASHYQEDSYRSTTRKRKHHDDAYADELELDNGSTSKARIGNSHDSHNHQHNQATANIDQNIEQIDQDRSRNHDRGRERNREHDRDQDHKHLKSRYNERKQERERNDGNERPPSSSARTLRDKYRESHSSRDYRGSRHHSRGSSSRADVSNCDDKEGHYIIRINDDLTPKYKIVSLRGEGTFGKVVECCDRQTGKSVAIKIIRGITKYRDAAKIEIKVLETLKNNNPDIANRCIELLEWFDYRNHICMVFDLFGLSIFDFLRDNLYYPFPLLQIRSIAKQLLEAVGYVHSLRMVHTDIKPENVLFVNSDYEVVPSKSSPTGDRRSLVSTELKLIDFGSTVFEKDHHSTVVSTRHYRAPEIILGLGWAAPCDIWSVGCLLVELYSGETIFQTHDNLEHLAMMTRVFGKFPRSMQVGEVASKFFRNGRLDYPNDNTSTRSESRVARLKPLKDMIYRHDDNSRQFVDLLDQLLQLEPHKRITATMALKHPFFSPSAEK